MFPKKSFFLMSLLILLLSLCKLSAAALPLQATVVPEFFEGGKGSVFVVLTLEKGWKLYAPASETDSLSYDPNFSFETSKNLKKVKPFWPDSLKIESNGLVGHAYKNAVIVPLSFEASNPKESLLLKGSLKGLVCSDTSCQPVTVPLKVHLVPGQAIPDPEKLIASLLAPRAAPLATHKEGISLGAIILIALLGGLILNVMPCVLPVLGIKLMVLTKSHTSSCNAFPTRELWMTVAGIYSTFMAFALGTLILKSLGETIGWGIHFQNPYFLSFMIVIMLLFTANMLGFFELAAPSWTQRFISFSRLARWKSFFSGILSVLLATPCAAPFVGTAVGFALARKPLDIFSVFLALATGFSSPYWITAFLPSHVLPLPKPGPWLVIFQRCLGVLLIGTIVWLVFLLTSTQGMLFTLLLYGLLICIFLSFMGLRRGWLWPYVPLILGVFMVLASPLAPRYLPESSLVSPWASTPYGWLPFEPDAIPKHLARGQVVLVDLTASWCLTCHVNKRFVLQAPALEKVLQQHKIVRMRGDWTTANPDIPPFLARFEKAGIPFNVVFGPNAPDGIVLPEILTISDVINAITEAKGVS